MDLSPAPRPERAESVVPMINVVFLLLIFFLMSATLIRPMPLEAVPPRSDANRAEESAQILVVNSAGELGFGAARGQDAIKLAAQSVPPLYLRADRAVSAQKLVRTVSELTSLGMKDIRLLTEPVASDEGAGQP
ncbi:MAG: biopolymer transporter ExbD [Neomegalonema sp.]|nr:biopolymer transporter ExbD [Neomegalonema sp.]